MEEPMHYDNNPHDEQNNCDDWDLFKENIKPRRGGRYNALLENLTDKEKTHDEKFTQDKHAHQVWIGRITNNPENFELWLEFIKWIEKTYPTLGPRSGYAQTLEQVTRKFISTPDLSNDDRYISLWMKYIDTCENPLEVFNFLHSKGIGIMRTKLYINWSEKLLEFGKVSDADEVLRKALIVKSDPLDKLKQYFFIFSKKMMQIDYSNTELDEKNDDSEMKRIVFSEINESRRKMGKKIQKTRPLGISKSYKLNEKKNNTFQIYTDQKPSENESIGIGKESRSINSTTRFVLNSNANDAREFFPKQKEISKENQMSKTLDWKTQKIMGLKNKRGGRSFKVYHKIEDIFKCL